MTAQVSKKSSGRVRGRPFPKGQSGNPGGRFKEVGAQSHAQEYMRRTGQAELESLAEQNKDLHVKLGALKVLEVRAYGQPQQVIEHTGTVVTRFIDEYPDGRRVVREVERQAGTISGIAHAVH